MNAFKIFTLPVGWLIALLLLSSFAGCQKTTNGDGTAVVPVDKTAPTVTTVMPASGVTSVPPNSRINANFSKSMDTSTITTSTFTLTNGNPPVPVLGLFTYSSIGATFKPTNDLSFNTLYTATITTGVQDTASNALASNYSWSFSTITTTDIIASTIISRVPDNSATGVALNSSVNATFSEDMDPATFTPTTFTLKQGTKSVTGSIRYLGKTAVFYPSINLVANTAYTATVTTGVTDMSGNALASNSTWIFYTGATAVKGPEAVKLGTAVSYAILAETAITSTTTAGTTITGDIAISPAAASYITGFTLALDNLGSPSGCFSTTLGSPAPRVTGKVYAADYNGACPTPANLTTAIGDMMIAFNDAAGRAIPDHTELGAGDISGLTLVPGLYKWGTGVLVNTDVTLSGSPNDVWIFQISGDLTVANGAHMLLSGGALPKNIFWQVAGGTGVAIGTTAHFEGVILASKAITLNTGATGNGRLLARTAVTLDSNVVTQPAP